MISQASIISLSTLSYFSMPLPINFSHSNKARRERNSIPGHLSNQPHKSVAHRSKWDIRVDYVQWNSYRVVQEKSDHRKVQVERQSKCTSYFRSVTYSSCQMLRRDNYYRNQAASTRSYYPESRSRNSSSGRQRHFSSHLVKHIRIVHSQSKMTTPYL